MADDAPKYQRIADDLRGQIESGKYPVGSQLPSKTELKATYRVAQNTVDGALRELIKAGLIEPRQGSGTFVLAQHPAEPGADELAGQVTALRAELAGLREKVSEIEAKLIDLYGKNGYEYRASEDDDRGRERRARHG